MKLLMYFRVFSGTSNLLVLIFVDLYELGIAIILQKLKILYYIEEVKKKKKKKNLNQWIGSQTERPMSLSNQQTN